MRIRAVIFDFDGVILETEEPDYLAWREVWSSFGQELVLDEWASCIGTSQDTTTFHPFQELVRRSGLDLVEAEIRIQKRDIAARLLEARPAAEGVRAWLAEAAETGLKVGIASSSGLDWIATHLDRLGLRAYFEVIACLDDCGVTKPDPTSYLEASRRLGVSPRSALAVEDSLNGVTAAKRAGLACVAVPTAMTAHMDLSAADLVLPSLRAVSLGQVVEWLDHDPTD